MNTGCSRDNTCLCTNCEQRLRTIEAAITRMGGSLADGGSLHPCSRCGHLLTVPEEDVPFVCGSCFALPDSGPWSTGKCPTANLEVKK
jgi:hypothetical protein